MRGVATCKETEKLGFNKVAKYYYYYYPAWWDCTGQLAFYVGAKAWSSLPQTLLSRSSPCTLKSDHDGPPNLERGRRVSCSSEPRRWSAAAYSRFFGHGCPMRSGRRRK